MKPDIKNQIYVYYLTDWRFFDNPNDIKDEDWFCFASKYNSKRMALKTLYERWGVKTNSISLHDQFIFWDIYKISYENKDFFRAVSNLRSYKYIKNIKD